MTRILVKFSGEALGGVDGFGFDLTVLQRIAFEIKQVVAIGIEVAIVLGGGNFCRGKELAALPIHPTTRDSIGMYATVMNCLALRDVLQSCGQEAEAFSALGEGCLPRYQSFFVRQRLAAHVVTLLAGGTGNPFFTTDTAAVLRGIELDCSLILKGTKVDYVFDKDPYKHADAKAYKELSYSEALHNRLQVMDATAFTLLQENAKKARVFNMSVPGRLIDAAQNQGIGTLLYSA